jgi:WD40 repeat protein
VEHAVTSGADGASHYPGLSDVKKFDRVQDGPVVALEHFNSLSESLLVYANRRGVISGWDLRRRASSFALNMDQSMGVLTAMAVGPSQFCLLAGTSRGFIVLWDLRFQVPVQVWRHYSKSRIMSLTPVNASSVLARGAAVNELRHPQRGPLMFVSAEGNEISAFDLLTGECRCVFRINTSDRRSVLSSVMQSGSSRSLLIRKKKKHVHTRSATNLDDWPAAAAAAAAAAASASPGGAGDGGGGDGDSNAAAAAMAVRPSIRVSPLSLPSLRSYMMLGSAYKPPALDGQFAAEFKAIGDRRKDTYVSSFLCCRENFVLTAGTDRTVRFWDLRDPTDSYRVTAPGTTTTAAATGLRGGNKRGDVRFKARMGNNTAVFEELASSSAPVPLVSKKSSSSSSSSDAKHKQKQKQQQQQQSADVLKGHRGPTPASTAHKDIITDMKALQFPQNMLVTSSRDGLVKVWV